MIVFLTVIILIIAAIIQIFVLMGIGSLGNANDATMIVVMTVIILPSSSWYLSIVALGSIGKAEDATMIVVIKIIILIVIIQTIISYEAALVMQRMLR